jgi:hypothetical protein
MPGPVPDDVSQSFHVLKDQWDSKTHIKTYCDFLLDEKNFDGIVESTRRAAPMREKDFRFDHELNMQMDVGQRERLWERAIYVRWNAGIPLTRTLNAWERLIGFQVPLQAGGEQKDQDRGWGKIDALGVYQNSLVVVEIKKEPNVRNGITVTSETPLKILLQSVAYALAIEENWKFVREQVLKLSSNPQLSENPGIKLVAAVPAAYWLDWLPVTDKGTYELSLEVWNSLFAVVDMVEKKLKFPMTFVSLSGDPTNPDSLAVQPLPGLRRVLCNGGSFK